MITHDPGRKPQHDARGRRVLKLADIARVLEHRLHHPSIDLQALRAGCRYAIEHGLGAVTCRPEHVTEAAKILRDTNVGLIAGLDFDHRHTGDVDEQAWTDQARRLSGEGASELAVIANAERLSPDRQAGFVAAVQRLASLQGQCGFRLRVHLDATGLSDAAIAAACRVFAACGVWMVQGGTWLGERVAFRHVTLMREALGPGPLLKWTNPVSSLHVLLLAIAEGVDRFNADVADILSDASWQECLAPLTVPLEDVDY
jgi:deoxyribose-phosphate aldolase